MSTQAKSLRDKARNASHQRAHRERTKARLEQCKLLEARCAEQETELTDYKTLVGYMKQQSSILMNEVSELRRTHDKAEAWETRAKTLTEQLAELRIERDQLETTVDELKTDVKRLTHAFGDFNRVQLKLNEVQERLASSPPQEEKENPTFIGLDADEDMGGDFDDGDLDDPIENLAWDCLSNTQSEEREQGEQEEDYTVWPPVVAKHPPSSDTPQAFDQAVLGRIETYKLLRSKLKVEHTDPVRVLVAKLHAEENWGLIQNGKIRRWLIRSNSFEKQLKENPVKATFTGSDSLAHYAYMQETLAKEDYRPLVKAIDPLIDELKGIVGCTDPSQPDTVAIHSHEGSSQRPHMDTSSPSIVALVHLDPGKTTEVMMSKGGKTPRCWKHGTWVGADVEKDWLVLFGGNNAHHAPNFRMICNLPRLTLLVSFTKETTEIVYKADSLEKTSRCYEHCHLCTVAPDVTAFKATEVLLKLLRELKPDGERNFAATRYPLEKSRTEFPHSFDQLGGKPGTLRRLERYLERYERTRMSLTSISYLYHKGGGKAPKNTWHIDTDEVSSGPNAVMLVIALQVRWRLGKKKRRPEAKPRYTVLLRRREQDEPTLLELDEGEAYFLNPSQRRTPHKFRLPPGIFRCAVRIGGTLLPLEKEQ